MLFDPSADAEDSLSSVTRELRPITLEEMDGVALLNRVDTKYAFGADDLVELLRAVADDYRVLEVEDVRQTRYQTLYYDTPDRRCFNDHHNGKLNRRKFRVRAYESSGMCFLEVKLKNNKGRTDKKRMRLDSFDDATSSVAIDFLTKTTGSTLPLVPQLWTRFNRLTLVGQSHAERATLDTQLSFEADGKEHMLDGLAIGEVKQSADDRSSPICQALRNRQVRPMRISKYCLGSMLLDPSLKRNRFKPKLLALDNILPTPLFD